MRTDTKIQKVIDPRSFRHDLQLSFKVLQFESEAAKKELLSRSEDAERRIGSTADLNLIERLHSFQAFLKSVASVMDCQTHFITRIVENFNSIDEGYWDLVIRGQEIMAENNLLKTECDGLAIRIQILESALKKELEKSRKQIKDLEMKFEINQIQVA